jgi:hypothetical protein
MSTSRLIAGGMLICIYAATGFTSLHAGTLYDFSYRARLSKADHLNSRGVYLRGIRSILRQDRANLYRFGGDPEDERDPFYYDPSARSSIEYAQIVPVGCSFEELKKRIIYGAPLVKITRRGNQLRIKILQENMQKKPARIEKYIGYRTRLSYRDHYNSRGRWLNSAGSILHQDRANYYLFGGDPEDMPDPYFRSKRARAAMQYSHIVPIGMTYSQMHSAILNGTPLVDVKVDGNTLYVRIVQQ